MSDDLMSYLDAAVSGWVLLATAAGLLIVHEIGYRLGRRHRVAMLEAQKSQADLLVPSLLGLVSLLLAFSFDIAQSRFDQRKALVIDDANAIGTTYLRAKTLPAPYDEHLQVLLREYIGDRLGAHRTAELQAALARSGELHNQLWAETTAVARANPDSEVVGRFIDALNHMIDVHEARVMVVLFQRMPRAILGMLFVVSALAIGMAGFRSGLDRTRALFSSAVLILAITAVLALIVDLDRPASRMFQVSQRAMEDLGETVSHDARSSARSSGSGDSRSKGGRAMDAQDAGGSRRRR
jgi:hypothetical protein